MTEKSILFRFKNSGKTLLPYMTVFTQIRKSGKSWHFWPHQDSNRRPPNPKSDDIPIILTELVTYSRFYSNIDTKQWTVCLHSTKNLIGKTHSRAQIPRTTKQKKLHITYICLPFYFVVCFRNDLRGKHSILKSNFCIFWFIHMISLPHPTQKTRKNVKHQIQLRLSWYSGKRLISCFCVFWK